MNGRVFVAPGDITQLAAHAVAYSSSTDFGGGGNLFPSFRKHIPTFGKWFDSLRHQHAGKVTVGDAFWMPTGPGSDSKPLGIVVVIATGGPATDEDKAGIAVRAAIGTAVQRLRDELGRAERLLVALPAFRIGMGGDRNQRLRSARVQIRAAMDSLAESPRVDVAFVTYTTAIYQTFLEARRQVFGDQAPEIFHPSALEHALLAGECVIFAGAGLSRGAGLPDWSELVARLTGELGIPADPPVDYLDLAQWYRERFGPEKLAEVIRSLFGDPTLSPRPTLAHYLLMSMPVRHVITTNYDDLLERALTAMKRYPVKIVKQQDVALTGRGDGVSVIKLHGDATDAAEIVLCRDDYDEFFERRPAMASLLEGLLLNQTFFFVGYGLRDPNFRQVFSRIARILSEARRPAFATTFEAAGAARKYLDRQWENKRLQLIDIPGTSREEQEHQFLCFLDGLAERVAMRSPKLFMARDVEVPEAVASLRVLLEHVGTELVHTCKGLGADDAGSPDVRPFSQILGFLADHGWRPRSGWEMVRLWERLAERSPDPVEKRRLLIAALGVAERFDDVERVRHRLSEMERGD